MRRRRKSRFALHVPRSPWRRLALLLVTGLVALAFYYNGQRLKAPEKREATPVPMRVAQEAALGLHAASHLIRQHGGLDPDPDGQALLGRIGGRLVAQSGADSSSYRFSFQLLIDHRTIDVFVLPGGYVLMTAGLAARLRTEGEFAALLAHALAHSVRQDPARQLGRLLPAEAWPSTEALTAFDPGDSTSVGYAAVAALVAQATEVAFRPEDEAEADTMAVRFMADAGYDPRALTGALTALESASRNGTAVAFFQSHPSLEDRLASIQRAITARFPEGVPEEMVK